jgi:protein tyrosine/serine phosphatase
MRSVLNNRKVRVAGFLLPCLALYFLWDFEIQKNFHTVLGEKLYRSGQPREEQLEHWIKKYHLKTIISLKPGVDAYEKEIAKRNGVTFHHIAFSTQDIPSEDQLQKILALLTDEQNMPLLYHCQGGADKTGLVTAVYRVEVQHWPLWKALLEMDLRYHIPCNRPVLQKYLRSQYGKHTRAEKPQGES